MKRISLAGLWRLSEPAAGRDAPESPVITEPEGIPGRLPGCAYLDLMAQGLIPDPYWGQNEQEARKIANRDFEYSRSFSLGKEDLDRKRLDLVVSGLDTLADISLNGALLASADNVFRTWRFDIKDRAREGENTLQIRFKNPFPVIEREQAAYPMVSMAGIRGVAHIRKVQSHFGWDWGPCLPPAGISGDIALESYDHRIEECIIRQEHAQGTVTLRIRVKLQGEQNPEKTGAAPALALDYSLTDPDGSVARGSAAVKAGEAAFAIVVEKPRLWWCNGLGGQALYRLSVALKGEAAPFDTVDSVEKTLGLRTLSLDTRPEGRGRAFRFVINGVPVFARGADWIPSDAFVTRTQAEDLRFYIESAKWANMNMLRVWGGGYYESDEFYELCDENGILVWQDFCFACSSYPFGRPEFIENLRQEVIDNVRRLRHHPSLALWSGNNENEILNALWKRKKELYESNTNFYYDTLAAWVEELDGVTPYWPGSPSSGERGRKANDLNAGDTHLWQIWHGLMPVEYFRRLPTRFCSEFGLESFPSTRALRLFTDDGNPKITDPVMMAHQKSAGGNQKILFYLLAKYRGPARFSGMVYLSQLTQAEAMAFAVSHWRRNMARCGGALYWQYNDCWPVASWAGIDYGRQYKALHYQARHFNKPICLSNDYYNDRAELYLANDLPEDFSGVLEWKLADFSGATVNGGTCPVSVPGVTARGILTLNYRGVTGGLPRKRLALSLKLRRGNAQGEIVDEKRYLLVPDKAAALSKPHIAVSALIKDHSAHITLRSDVYARRVYLEVEGVTAPLSDNFFDIEGQGSCTVTVPLPAGMDTEDAAAFTRRIKVWSLADLESSGSLMGGSIRRFAMRFQPINLITWFLFKFL